MSYDNLKKVYLEKYRITVCENGTVIGVSGKKINGSIDKDGYIRITVRYKENDIIIKKKKFAHRLIAEAFLKNYSNSLVVNHKNGIKDNNCVSNLEMCTISENTIHAINNGFLKIQGEFSPLNKYSEDFVIAIFKKLKTVKRLPNGNIKPGELMKIAKELNTTRQVVKNYSKKRKIWKHLNI